MAKLETLPTLEQILDDIDRLSNQEQRVLAAAVLKDRRLEAFVEELDDQLDCEKAAEEGPPEPFCSEINPTP
jgi:hypothetical protein